MATEKKKPGTQYRTHWTKRRKIEELERMISDIEERKVQIRGRNTLELLHTLRAKIEKLSA